LLGWLAGSEPTTYAFLPLDAASFLVDTVHLEILVAVNAQHSTVASLASYTTYCKPAMRNLSLQGERKRRIVPVAASSCGSGSSSTKKDPVPPPTTTTGWIVDVCSVPVDAAAGAAGGAAESSSFSSSKQHGSSLRALLTAQGYIALVDDEQDRILWEVQSLNQFCCSTAAANEQCCGWFNLTYIDSASRLVCLNRNGAIVVVHTNYETEERAELVGEFENGIVAAAWSSDREVLLLVTSAEDDDDPSKQKSVLLTMSSQFDVLAEQEIEKLADATDVAVCWTGSSQYLAVSSVDAADHLRKIRIYKGDTLELHSLGRTEDGSGKLAPNILPSEIAWAGPGCSHLLAAVQRKGKKTKQIAFLEPNGLRHRELVLRDVMGDDSTVVNVVGLDWNVESDLLAVTLQSHDNDSNAPLSSKVQLWHRSNYHWYLKREWCFAAAADGGVVSRVKFHDEDPYLLFVSLRNVQQQQQELRWIEYRIRWDSSTINNTFNNSDNKTSATTDAFAIDGCQLNMSDFETAFVPPPMYARTMTMEAPVNEVAFARDSQSSCYCVVLLSNGKFVVLDRAVDGKLRTKPPGFAAAPAAAVVPSGDPLSIALDPTAFRSLVIVKSDTSTVRLVALATGWDKPGQDFLAEISVAAVDDGSGSEARVTAIHILKGRCLTLTQWSDSANGAVLQLEDGSLLEYEAAADNADTDADAAGNLTPSQAEALLEPCPWLVALKNVENLDNSSEQHIHRPRLVVGMSSRYRLYLHDVLLADSISSFFLSIENQYLCYASAGSRCILRFLALIDLFNFDPLAGSDENHRVLEGYEPRNVERGSRLVAVLSSKPSAVLQMPRGNLEVIHPRALVLRHVMVGTEQRRYKETFELMRKQKIDLNLIVDMNPWYFLEEGITAFVDQIESIDHLNLFVSSLQNWNSTEQRYPIPHWFVRQQQKLQHHRSSTGEPFDFASKVNLICGRLRAVMIQAERDSKTVGGRPVTEGHFLLPILSTYAKEDPPKVGDALQMIKVDALARHNPAKSSRPALFSESAQGAIQYLAFLADYELLFETALGLYDFDLGRAVARNSQMDPKVYLPLLKRYKEMPLYYGRFEVDVRLKRFDLALRHLSKSGALGEELSTVSSIAIASEDATATKTTIMGNDFEACLRLIEEHKLFRLGLELFGEKEQRNRIMLSLGDHLLVSNRAETALNVFLSSDPVDIDRAIRAAKDAKNWAVLFSLLSSRGLDEDSLALVAREIANDLSASAEGYSERRTLLFDASRVLLDYAKDVAGAVDMLIRAKAWSEGKRTSCLHMREDLSLKVINAAVDYAYSAMEDFAEQGRAFGVTSLRYAEVLRIRKEAISAGDGEPDIGVGEQDDDGSLFSAASNASNLSTTSTSSTGSAVSLSSVISVKSSTSFSVSGFDENYRHKSRFNKLGRTKKQKRKKKGKSKKIRPGSEEELQGLVETLKVSCVDEKQCASIADAIAFLVQCGKLNVARALYDSYISLCSSVRRAQEERIGALRKQEHECAMVARREGTSNRLNITHSVEAAVDSLACSSLPSSLHELFFHLPSA